MAIDFVQLQNILKSAGFYDFILPWLLAFSITFGILQTVNVFKKGDGKLPNTSVDGIIALVVAFYLTIFTPFPGFLSSFFGKLFGSAIIVLSGILVLLIFVGIFGFKSEALFHGTKSKIVIMIVALILAAFLFFNANAGIFTFGNMQFNAGESLTLIIFLGIIGLVIWYVMNEGKSSSPDTSTAAPAERPGR